MPLFLCDRCDAAENTALGQYWLEAERLCSECGTGKWHNFFPRLYGREAVDRLGRPHFIHLGTKGSGDGPQPE